MRGARARGRFGRIGHAWLSAPVCIHAPMEEALPSKIEPSSAHRLTGPTRVFIGPFGELGAIGLFRLVSEHRRAEIEAHDAGIVWKLALQSGRRNTFLFLYELASAREILISLVADQV